MLSALDMLPLGIVVVNRYAKVLFANAYASALLSASVDLNVIDGVLRARSIPHNRALSEALEALACATAREPIGFSIARTDQRPISIAFVKLPHLARNRATPGRSRIGVFLSDPDLSHHASASLVRELFHFTSVESSIAILMMDSLGTAAIADQLKITGNTLRDHLKSMFAKTHTRNQAELLHTLLRCPAGLRFPPE